MPRYPLVVSCMTAAVGFGLAAALFVPPPASDIAEPNDNRQSAGSFQDGLLRVALEVRAARWFPEGDSGRGVEIAAFAETGGRAQVPAPLIRVAAGAVIRATLHNALRDSAVTIHGFVTRPAATPDTVRLAPGESRVVTFAAGAPGTYFYWANVGSYRPEPNRLERIREREQLAGALIVDEPGTPPADRVFVMNAWGEPADSDAYRVALTINGRSWPHTERVTAQVGDTLRWRVINATLRNHPMHLHGFYYQITAAGTAWASQPVPPTERPFVVTRDMRLFHTMDMTWSPDRPGNWLFHCHIAFHVIPDTRLDPPPAAHHHSADARQHMAGLILGVQVREGAGAPQAAGVEPQRLRLFVQEGRPRSHAARALGFVRQRGTTPPRPDSVEIPGSVLVLTRGTPANVTVVNRLAEPTAVHWHGIELESYWDGVAGWSGDATRVAGLIAPGDSFVAQLRLPRAGTFMYHTHLNDVEQLTSGLYGPIVVLEPGQRWDPQTDHVVVIAWDGDGDPAPLAFDGTPAAPPLHLAARRTHRLRLINIGPAGVPSITLHRDTTLAAWRPVAKDGADLPPPLRRSGAARIALAVGETYDVEFTPPAAGDYELRAALPGGQVSRRVIVN